MARSAILRGAIDARNRAKLRGRQDKAAREAGCPYDHLWNWLEASAYADADPLFIARLDSNRYLRETGSFDIPPEERLRQLAIFLETKTAHAHLLDRLYEAALRLAPKSAEVHHSRGITAKLVAGTSEDPKRVTRFRALALRSLEQAQSIDPEDAGIAYSLGKWHYEFGSVDDAAIWFDKALRFDPAHGYARLFRAHCLHDQARWSEAVEAYRAVPQTRIGHQARDDRARFRNPKGSYRSENTDRI